MFTLQEPSASPCWETQKIKVGTGYATPHQFVTAMRSAHVEFNTDVSFFISSDNVKLRVSPQERDVTVAFPCLADLGFEEAAPVQTILVDRPKELGLEFCTLETAMQYAMQFPNTHLESPLIFVTDPEENNGATLRMKNGESNLRLARYSYWPLHRPWYTQFRLVFTVPSY